MERESERAPGRQRGRERESFWVIGFSVVNSPCRHAQQLEVTVRRSGAYVGVVGAIKGSRTGMRGEEVRGRRAGDRGRAPDGGSGKKGNGKARGRGVRKKVACFEWQYNTAAKQWSTV